MLLRQIASPAAAPLRLILGLAVVLLLLLSPLGAAGQGVDQPIVQCILFYKTTCPHCHLVINELLVPMQEQYEDQLQILAIDTSNAVGNSLYTQAVEKFMIPTTRQGVPTLIIGQTVLVGSGEIPAEFPALVEVGLAAGGIGWPDVPGLAIAIPDLPPSADPYANPGNAAPATATPGNEQQRPDADSMASTVSAGQENLEATDDGTLDAVIAQTPEELALDAYDGTTNAPESLVPPADPVGFSLAGLTLFGMAGALAYVARAFGQPSDRLMKLTLPINSLSWAVPILALAGLSVALYLSYVEMNQVEAICGPIGECNIVQSSSYARLLGIPVAVLGVLSYIAILMLWIGIRNLEPRLGGLSLSGLLALTIFGTLFSIYLTVLELFVIKAVCAWCLSSAVLTTLLMVLVARSWRRDSAN